MRHVATYNNSSAPAPILWLFDYDVGVHIVTYGHDRISTSDSLDAARAFGEFMHHAVECAGLLDGGPVENINGFSHTDSLSPAD